MSLNQISTATRLLPALGLAIVLLIVGETAAAVEGVPVVAAVVGVVARAAGVVGATAAAMVARGTRRNRQITEAAIKIVASWFCQLRTGN
jgi:hypothetical protein